jgi:hypothetical protein
MYVKYVYLCILVLISLLVLGFSSEQSDDGRTVGAFSIKQLYDVDMT